MTDRDPFDAIGASVADNLEAAFGTMADTLARLLTRVAELEQNQTALVNRIEAITRLLHSHSKELRSLSDLALPE